jgi:hypothetical protein
MQTVDSKVTGWGFHWAQAAVFLAGQGDRQTGHYLLLEPVWSEKYSCRSIIHKGPESHDYTCGVFNTHLVCSIHRKKILFQPARIHSKRFACGNLFAGFPEIPSHYMVL